MFLALIALIFALGAPGNLTPPPASPAPRSPSHLPATQPGLSKDEGVFLVTAAADGRQAIYFIAQNTRHAITVADMQTEQQINALWPVRTVLPENAMAYPEGAPIGIAPMGLLSAPQPLAEVAPEVAIAEPRPSETSVYVLQRGDNLTRLAERFGTSVEAILAVNGLANANRIFFGQPLVMPGASTSDAVVESPAPQTPVADEAADTAAAQTTSYTVKPGDSAFVIARKFGVDQAELLAANDIRDANRVYAGQVLQIPSL